jgi:hypothetical protein
MGIVYLALAQGPGGFAKLKVVKRLRPDLAGEPAAVQMFLEEGRLSARLHHPNVVQMNEVGFDGKHYFLEMEYLEGQSFTAITKRAAKTSGLSLPLAVYVLAQTLAGLHYAHELRDHDGTPLAVVHRDVSPHNVLVTYDGRVKVLDFGIAKAVGSSSETKTGFLKGKVTYMAPEQVARKTLDRRVDVFAVGVMLWEALTGERMWGDLDDFDIFLKLRSEAIPPPRSVRADIPEALDAVCMKALAREPAERFATAEEMERALEDWLDTSDRVGVRELAARMNELFAEDRAATKAEVEAQIKATPVDGSQVGVPILQSARAASVSAITGTGLGTTSKTIGEGTRVRQARQIRGLRAIAFASVGIALVASVAAGVTALRGKRAKGGAAGAGSASAAAVAAECAKSAECNVGDAAVANARVCRKGKCVALATEQCEVLAEPGDANDDRTVWIGAMFPRSGPAAALNGVPDTNAINLARRDFEEVTRGIPSRSVAAPPRPLGIVACDDAKDEKASALHLVNAVGVPAVVGFRTSQEAIELSRDLFVPRGVMVVSVNPSAQVTQVPQPPDGPRLVWRTALASTLTALPTARVVSELLEPRLRKAGTVSEATPTRVALILPKSQFGLSIGDALRKVLSFNGQPALANGDNLDQITFELPGAPGSDRDLAAIATEFVHRAPHIIVYAGEDELVETVFNPVERDWQAKGYRPYWLSVTNLGGADFFRFLRKHADARRRFLGVSAPENTAPNAQLAQHYSAEFTKMTVNDTPAAAYDSAYLIAYAAFASNDEPLSGGALAKAIARLSPPGVPIDVGPTHIFEAMQALRRGENIDLVGANTRLDFDLVTGETTADMVIQCVGVDASGLASDAIESGAILDAASGKLRGELRCP